MEGKYVVFHIGKEKLGVPIESVERILQATPVTRIPRSPKMVKGMFSNAGVTIPVIDCALRFDIPAPERYEHFLVISTQFGRFALLVEGVDKIIEFDSEHLDSAENWLASIEPDLAIGVGKYGETLCMLVRPEAIVPVELQKRIDKAAA